MLLNGAGSSDTDSPDDVSQVRAGRPNAGSTGVGNVSDPVRIGIPGGALTATVTHSDVAVGTLVQPGPST